MHNGYVLWDALTGGHVDTFKTSGSGPVAFSPNGEFLAACRATELALYDLSAKKKTWSVARPDTVSPMAVAFNPAGDLLAYVHDRAGIRLLDAASGATLCNLTLTPPPDRISRLEFDRTGGRLLAATPFHGVRVWDLRAIRDRLAGVGLDWPGGVIEIQKPTPTVTGVELDPTGLHGK